MRENEHCRPTYRTALYRAPQGQLHDWPAESITLNHVIEHREYCSEATYDEKKGNAKY